MGGYIHAGSTDTSQAVCSSRVPRAFEYPAPWTPRTSKDGDSVQSNGGEITDLK